MACDVQMAAFIIIVAHNATRFPFYPVAQSLPSSIIPRNAVSS